MWNVISIVFELQWKTVYWNRPVSQIPLCIRQIIHNAPFCNRNVHTHFCYKMLHCGIWIWCIVGFVHKVYWPLLYHGQFFQIFTIDLTHSALYIVNHMDWLIGPWEMWKCIFQTHFPNWYIEHFLWNWSYMTEPHRTPLINISLVTGFVLSGNKPSLGLKLTQIYVPIWCHLATMS